MISTRMKLVAGSHCWIARENRPLSRPTEAIVTVGTSGVPSVVGRDAKPSKDDTAWNKLGIIDTGRVRPGNMSALTVHDSSPGHLVVDDMIALGQERVISFRCSEVQVETVELLFATAMLDQNSTQFNPDEGTGSFKCWLKFQAFDNEDRLVLTLDQWVLLFIPDDVEFSNKALTQVSYEAHCMRAALNTGA
jgi:hypothetical protein